MPDIHIHRPHTLGLERAREVAWKWAEEVENKFDMACTVEEGDASDTVSFTRSGVNGSLVVAPDHFELQARLGFLLGAFARTIEQQIESNLDALLAAETVARKPKAAARKTAAPKTPAADVAPAAPAAPKSTRGRKP